MKESVIGKIKNSHVVTICFCALLATTCYGTEVEFPCDMQVTGNVSAGSFSGNGFVIVSAAGTDTENGTDLLDALDGITASATNPYLLKLEPGIYDIGDQSLQMKEYVDIEGSGESTSKITGTRDSYSAGVVQGASNSELRFITVENTGGGTDCAIAIYNYNSSPKITNVTATAFGAPNNRGIYSTNSSSPIMTNVSVSASGGTTCFGIFNASSSSPTMINVTASASGGATNYGIYSIDPSNPVMNNVTAAASGGGYTYAIYNGQSSPTMTNVIASASGGSTYNYAINNASSSPTMNNVTATASGSIGTTNYAIWNGASSPTMTNVTATAWGGIGSTNCGLRNWDITGGTFEIFADRSTFEGSTYAIDNDDEFTLNIGASKLGGVVDTEGTYNCGQCYDGYYDALNSVCQ